jgi:2,4-dienoyl-CoA reductase-like NADH-dependent reductase (Old Yellow Enzyme family)
VAGAARLLDAARRIQRRVADLPVLGSGYSYFRHLLPQVAAGALGRGWVSMVGLGRMAFAYPEFARDILRNGALDPQKVCIACSLCTQIMRDGGRAGCPVRDRDVYGPILREGRRRARQKENVTT